MKNLAEHKKNLENISKTLPTHNSLQSKQHRTRRNKTKHTHAPTTSTRTQNEHKQTNKQASKQTNTQTHKQTKKQNKQINKQTNKQYKQYKNDKKQTQEAGPTICAHDLGTQAGPTI